MALGQDDIGADDCEANIIEVNRFTSEDGNPNEERTYLTLPADAVRDKEFMDWFLAPKEADSETNDDFNDLVCRRHELRKGMGGQPINKSDDFSPEENQLPKGNEDAVLRQLLDTHGKEHLEKLTPQELYAQYKAISFGQQKAIE